jgi:hypothetical protein
VASTDFTLSSAGEKLPAALKLQRRPTKFWSNEMDKIEALDLGPIKFKLMDEDDGEGWSLTRANVAEREYKRFLILNRDSEGTIVPSKEIDTFWHYHILDTAKYAEDCDAVFGKFLHHFPYFGLRGADDAANLETAFAYTKATYESRFGEPMLRSAAETNLGGSSGCGAVVCSVGSCNDGDINAHVRPTVTFQPATMH